MNTFDAEWLMRASGKHEGRCALKVGGGFDKKGKKQEVKECTNAFLLPTSRYFAAIALAADDFICEVFIARSATAKRRTRPKQEAK